MTQQRPAPPTSPEVDVDRLPVPVGHDPVDRGPVRRDRHAPAAGVLARWRQRPPVLGTVATGAVAAAGLVAVAVAAVEAGGRLLHQALRSLPTAAAGPATTGADRGVVLAGEVGPVVTRLHATWTHVEIHWSSG